MQWIPLTLKRLFQYAHAEIMQRKILIEVILRLNYAEFGPYSRGVEEIRNSLSGRMWILES